MATDTLSQNPAPEAASYLSQRRDTLRGVIRKQALIRPAGLAGAVVARFYAVLPASYPTSVFTEAEDAISWLAVS